MSNITALGNRPSWSSLFAPGSVQAEGKNSKATAVTSQPVTPVQNDQASLSSSGLDLQKRLADVGNSTIDLAQNLVGSFTQALFGDAGKGANISFDSVSLEAQSSFVVGVQHSQGANGTTDSAALQLTDSSHFLGKGTITTADGRKFDFEVEIKYSDELTAGASQSQDLASGQPTAPSASGNASDSGGEGNSAEGSSNLPTVSFPNIDFPGTLADLFKLIGHDLQSTLSAPHLGSDKSQSNNIDRTALRSLSLRLLSLIDKKNSDTYEPPSLAKSVADTYGAQSGDSPAASADSAAPAASAAPATTAAPADASTTAAATTEHANEATA